MTSCLLVLALLFTPAAHAGNKLSKRVQQRYEDVVVMRDGTKWRGKIVSKGATYRIRLDDHSEVCVAKEDVEAVTRELHPGLLHNGQWTINAYAGGEAAVQLGNNLGPRYGLYFAASFGHNFGGTLEPEIFVDTTPLGADDLITGNSIEFGVGARIYLTPTRKVKPFTETLIVTGGTHYDLGLRSGPGLLWDIGESFGLGFTQDFVLVVQSEPEIFALGYQANLTGQVRF